MPPTGLTLPDNISSSTSQKISATPAKRDITRDATSSSLVHVDLETLEHVHHSPHSVNIEYTHEADKYGEYNRAKLRYTAASEALRVALEQHGIIWKYFQFPDAGVMLGGDDIPKLREEIKEMLDSRIHPAMNGNLWGTCKQTIERFFSATRPFAKSFLTVAKEGSSVLS